MNKVQAEEKKLIKTEVQNRIKRGEPKQQILEEMSQIYKDKITIVKQLESIPSMAMKWKYLNYNHVMSVLLLAILILDGILLFKQWTEPNEYGFLFWINFIPYINVVTDLILLVGVLLYRVETYSWTAARAVVSLVEIIITHMYYHQAIDLLTWVVLLLVITSFLLGLFLGIKLCPPRVPKTIEIDVDGTEKINKIVYVFPD